jgi:hypothetical protein
MKGIKPKGRGIDTFLSLRSLGNRTNQSVLLLSVA